MQGLGIKVASLESDSKKQAESVPGSGRGEKNCIAADTEHAA